MEAPRAVKVSFAGDILHVLLSDGKQIVVPTALFPRLQFATQAERRNYRLVGGGGGIHWPALDEDISVKGLLAKKGSAESPKSIVQWLLKRKQGIARQSALTEIQILSAKAKGQAVRRGAAKHAKKLARL